MNKYMIVAIKDNVDNNTTVISPFTKNNPPIRMVSKDRSAISATELPSTPVVIPLTPDVKE
jgi:hypothetical protein